MASNIPRDILTAFAGTAAYDLTKEGVRQRAGKTAAIGVFQEALIIAVESGNVDEDRRREYLRRIAALFPSRRDAYLESLIQVGSAGNEAGRTAKIVIDHALMPPDTWNAFVAAMGWQEPEWIEKETARLSKQLSEQRNEKITFWDLFKWWKL